MAFTHFFFFQVEPVGRWFLSYWERLHAARGISLSGAGGESASESESEEEETEVEFEDDLDYLRSLDPKDVKNQDHYKVGEGGTSAPKTPKLLKCSRILNLFDDIVISPPHCLFNY